MAADERNMIVPAKQRATQISGWVEANLEKVRATLPDHVNPEKVARVFLNELSRVPKLLDCTQASLVGCFLQATALGLELGAALGQAYPVPFGRECTLIIGYRGLIDLTYRSGLVSTVSAYAVRDGDEFDYGLGSEPWIKHRPVGNNSGSELSCVYAIVKMRDGVTKMDVMYRDDVDKIRNGSRGKNSPAWANHYEEMAKKTILRRVCKTLPMSTGKQQENLRTAITLDEQADASVAQTFDVEVEVADCA